MDQSRYLICVVILAGYLFVENAYAITAWPDTGQNKCYNNYVQITCPQPGQPFYGQDAQHQGVQPSYTKLDANGNALPDSAAAWSMVRDNVTGLIWEVKTKDGGLHDAFKLYDWCDSTETPEGCGVETTEFFIKTLNSSKFGNQADWRLPTVEELTTLFDLAKLQLSINTNYFNNTVAIGPGEDGPDTIFSKYWTSNIDTIDSTAVWVVDYDWDGDITTYPKIGQYYPEICVMAVRGGKSIYINRFINNYDGTITDSVSGLMWQKDTSNVDTDPGADRITWEKALEYVKDNNEQNFAGYADWRLPNVNELLSLIDFYQIGHMLNPPLVPEHSGGLDYWSSTTHIYNDSAWHVGFDDLPGISAGTKTTRNFVRMVRAGNTVRFSLDVNQYGNGQGTVNSNPAGINCGSDCTASYDNGTTVTLTATPGVQSFFAGWSGDCSGVGACVVNINSHKYVSANFVNPSFIPTLAPIYYLLQK